MAWPLPSRKSSRESRSDECGDSHLHYHTADTPPLFCCGQIGSSLFDKEGAAIVEQLVRKAEERNVKLHFPVDYVCGNSFSKDAEIRIETDASGIPEGWMGLDVGPESAKNFGEVIASSKTLLWNGFVVAPSVFFPVRSLGGCFCAVAG